MATGGVAETGVRLDITGEFMRMWALVVVASLVAWTAGATPSQITENPLPAPVETKGLMVEVADHLAEGLNSPR